MLSTALCDKSWANGKHKIDEDIDDEDMDDWIDDLICLIGTVKFNK